MKSTTPPPREKLGDDSFPPIFSFKKIREQYDALPRAKHEADAALLRECRAEVAEHMALIAQLEAQRPKGTRDKAWQRALAFLTRHARGARVQIKPAAGGHLTAHVQPPRGPWFLYVSKSHTVLSEQT